MRPLAVALLVCENVIRGVDGKNSVINVFDVIIHPTAPVVHPSVFIYARLADVQQTKEVELQLVQAQTNLNLLSPGSAPISVQNPQYSTDVMFGLGAVALPAHGRYDFRLLADNQFIGSTPLYVLKARPTPQDPYGLGEAP